MGAAELSILLGLIDRVISWTTIVKAAHDAGRSLTSAEIDSFVTADDKSIEAAKIAYAKAVAEGR